MRTVKELSKITRISVRTLHYYDEIGLLHPTTCSDAGYRYYDDEALEKLQQILFFREFDMPLKVIKTIMDNPALDRNQILQSQRDMLELKKERLERLLSSMDDILKGENSMDFEVFSKAEIERLYQSIISTMTEEVKKAAAKEHGGLEAFHTHYVECASSDKMQRNYEKMMEWYGDERNVRVDDRRESDSQIVRSFQNRIDAIIEKLAKKKGKDVFSLEVKEVVGEYGFVMKQLYQIKNERAIMLELAVSYKSDEKKQKALDYNYGAGTAKFAADAIEAFYA